MIQTFEPVRGPQEDGHLLKWDFGAAFKVQMLQPWRLPLEESQRVGDDGRVMNGKRGELVKPPA